MKARGPETAKAEAWQISPASNEKYAFRSVLRLLRAFLAQEEQGHSVQHGLTVAAEVLPAACPQYPAPVCCPSNAPYILCRE